MTDVKLILMLSENWTLLDPRNIKQQVDLAVQAEKAGFDGVLVSEHIVMGDGADMNGIASNPRQLAEPGNQHPSMPWPSSTVLMSALAMATSSLRLIAAAVIAPLRHPLALAKELATLDLLSEGRLVVLPNVSWHKAEYDALNVPFDKRGRLLDEQLDILQTLWDGSGSAVSYDGEFWQFNNVWVEPSPWRPAGPTLWFGGGVHERMLNRLSRYGSGFMGMGPTTPEQFKRIELALQAVDRDITELEFVGGIIGQFENSTSTADLDAALGMLKPQMEAGLRTFIIKPSQFLDDPADFPAFAEKVVARARATAQQLEDS